MCVREDPIYILERLSSGGRSRSAGVMVMRDDAGVKAPMIFGRCMHRWALHESLNEAHRA